MKNLRIIGLICVAIMTAYTQAASEYIQSFEEETLTSLWTSQGGQTTLSKEHYAQGEQALQWVAQQDSACLTIQFSSVYNCTSRVFEMEVYSPYVQQGNLLVRFYNPKGTLVRETRFSLYFQGWRSVLRKYGSDFEQTQTASVKKVVFTLIGGNGTTVGLDNILFNSTTSASAVLTDINALDNLKTNGPVTANVPWFYSWLPRTKAPKANANQLAALAHIRDLYPITVPDSKTMTAGAAAKYVKSLGIERNEDGSIKGLPKIPTSDLGRPFWNTFTENLLTLAWAKINKGGDYATAFDDLLDQAFDQGLYYQFRGFSYSDYTEDRTLPLNMISILPACNEKQKAELLRSFKWCMEYGRIYSPYYNTEVNSDYFYILFRYVMMTASHDVDDDASVRELETVSRYLSNSTEFTEGTLEFLKRDGCSFHHNTHYLNYMYTFNSFCDHAASFAGTCMRMTEEAYERFKFAVISEFMMAGRQDQYPHYSAMCLAGRHPLADGNKIQFTQWESLFKIGNDIYGGLDEDLAAKYNYIRYANVGNVPAKDMDGFYQFNYCPIGVYRYGNWVATMRCPTTQFWGAEIYNANNGGNRFGRYQSHGSLEIVYNQATQQQSGLPKGSGGWDWNMTPGATTVHYVDWYEMMPSRNLSQRFDQYSKTTNFSGALGWGKCGMWGAEFDQTDSWGGQVFTPTNLVFHKSVYCVDGMLISLGSNISSNGSYSDEMVTATNLFQSVDPDTCLLIKGVPMRAGDEEKLLSVDLAGTWMITPEQTGYIVPKGNDPIVVKFQAQNCPNVVATDIDNPATTIGAKAYIKHEVKPSNHSYVFVCVPGTTPEKVQEIAAQISAGTLYRIEHQDEHYHALRYFKDSLLMASVYQGGMVLLDSVVSVQTPMLLMQKSRGTRTHFAVDDPNLHLQAVQKNEITIAASQPQNTSITLNGLWYPVKGSSEDIVVNHGGNQTTVQFTLSDGMPLYFSLDMDSTKAQEPNPVDDLENVQYGQHPENYKYINSSRVVIQSVNTRYSINGQNIL